MFLKENLSQFFQGKERLVLIRTLLKNFKVALGEALKVLCALGCWHIRNCVMYLGCRYLPSKDDCQVRGGLGRGSSSVLN